MENGWTRELVVKLLWYSNHGYTIRCNGETVVLHAADTDSKEFDLWCKGPDEWKTDEDEDAAMEGSPTLVYEDDRYGTVFYLEDQEPKDFTVDYVVVTPVPNWQGNPLPQENPFFNGFQ